MNWLILMTASLLFLGNAIAMENIPLGQELNQSMRQSGLVKIHAFTTDGCSMSPDGDLQNDWTECCVDHDIAYWIGGSRIDRLRADATLMACMNDKAGPRTAQLYFNGVRSGGRPFSVMPYRWGYGWNYMRTYESLSDQEKELIQIQLGGSLEDMKPRLRKTQLTTAKPELTFDYCDQLSIKKGHLSGLRGEVNDISMTVDRSLSMVTKTYFVSGEESPRTVHFNESTKVIDCYNP